MRTNLIYERVHRWLRKNYGKADKCENTNCGKVSLTFDWAKKKGKRYKCDREHFVMLCRSCHKKYDMTLEIIRKISIGARLPRGGIRKNYLTKK